MTLVPGMSLGVYQVTAPLGAGGMGEVYRATDSRLKRDVALKVLPADTANDPGRLVRLQREAEVLASLNHPNIAHIYGLEESGDTTALVMELVEGEDLSRRIARGAIPIHDALLIANQIASALEAAHEQGIIHRDLKPANIKVRPDGTVKILDFGLAKSLESSAPATNTVTAISSAGLIIGTPAYMSPEQARGEDTGPESDIWAFGVVLYEMLTGVSAFARASTTETFVQVLTAPLNESLLPAATPGNVRRLIRRCLERDKKRRWRDMGDARIEIEEALAPQAEPAPGAAGTATVQPTPVPRRQILRYGVASAALLASGLAGGAWLDRRLRPAALVPSYRRLTFRRGVIRSARFAPDGQTILYGALWDGDGCRVHVVRVDGPESRPLDLPDANVLAISKSGEVALSLGPHNNGVITYGTLAHVSLTGGAPRQILENVKFADWSPNGQDLAIIRRGNDGDQLEYPIGKVLVAPTAGESGLAFARISPDGKRVAFVQYRNPASLTGRVAMVDQSGAVTQLSPEYLNIHGLAWRGDDVMYTAADDRPLFRALCVASPGGASRTITRMPGNATVWDALPDGRLVIAHTDDRSVIVAQVRGDEADRDLSWLDASRLADLSLDGKLLLFTEFGQGGGPEGGAYLRGTDGSAAVRLGAGVAAALSPDTRWTISLSSSLPSPYLELLPTGAGEPRRIQGNGLGFYSARWLPDGKRIIVAAAEPGRPSKLFRLDVDSGRPTALTPEGVGLWAISPDGSTIAVQGPTPAVRLYGIDNSATRDVQGLSGGEVPLGWITDGLLIMRRGQTSSRLGDIYKVDIGTGRQDLWKNIFPRDGAGIMALTSFAVTPDGQSLAHTWHRALSNLYIANGLA